LALLVSASIFGGPFVMIDHRFVIRDPQKALISKKPWLPEETCPATLAASAIADRCSPSGRRMLFRDPKLERVRSEPSAVRNHKSETP
jgi:hypothetical protein